MDLKSKGKAYCKSITLCIYILFHCFIQITHLGDFKYWRIFRGLTIQQIKDREALFEYPPRLQIRCKQVDTTKPLYFTFTISKRSKKKEVHVAQFSLDYIVPGTKLVM